jgi:antitoxin component HigA of HigAB toxin-antitoxin module
MQEFSPIYSIEIPLLVDLDLICKYHELSKCATNHRLARGLSVKEFASQCKYFYRVIGSGTDELAIHPAYNLFGLPNDILPKNHADNLLYLVKAFITHEWTYYYERILDHNTSRAIYLQSNTTVDTIELGYSELEDFFKLVRASENANDITGLSFRYGKNKSTANGEIKNKETITRVLKYTIEDSFIRLQKPWNPFIKEIFKSIEIPTSKELEQLIESIEGLLLTEKKALSTFKRLLSITILNYLKEERVNKHWEEEMPGSNLEIVYMLLAMFGLIDDKLISKHRSVHDRTKYARSIIESPERNARDNSYKKTVNEFLKVKVID